MLQFFNNGSLDSCQAPASPCTCESKLYATTGTLALIAGLAQLVVGNYYSMAALSDALHALADAGADFVGMFIAHKVRGNPTKTKEWRSVGNKLIATLLVVGAWFIASESKDRWLGDSYTVWLPAVLFVGLLGLAIDLVRFRMLSKAREHAGNSNLEGLIEHARSDAWHSGIISAVAALAMLGSLLNLENGLYDFLVHLSDFLASIGLALYMTFILAPRIWKGEGCCGNHKEPSSPVPHVHGPGCKSHHH